MAGETGFQVVRMRRLEGSSKLKAFVDISVGDFVIKGFRVVEGKNGLFLGFPQEKAKDGKWYNCVDVSSKETQQGLADVVMAAYRE